MRETYSTTNTNQMTTTYVTWNIVNSVATKQLERIPKVKQKYKKNFLRDNDWLRKLN